MAKNQTSKSEGKKRPSVIKIILFVIGGLFVLGIIGSMFSDDDTESTNSNNNSTSQQQEEVKITYTEIDLGDFIDEYDENQVSADNKYEDTYIKSTGYIYDISEDFSGDAYLLINPTNDEWYLGTAVQCNLKDNNDVSGLKTDSKVTFRGKVTGMEVFNVYVDDCEVL